MTKPDVWLSEFNTHEWPQDWPVPAVGDRIRVGETVHVVTRRTWRLDSGVVLIASKTPAEILLD